MAQQRIPINQANAFPLQTLDASVAGGTVIAYGNTVVRSFAPADLGLSAVPINTADPNGGTLVWAFGNFIDVSFCNTFFFVLHRIVDTSLHDTAQGAYGVSIRLQCRDQGATALTGSLNTDAVFTVAAITTNPANTVATPPSYPDDHIYAIGTTLVNGSTFAGNSVGALLGASWRPCLQASGASAVGVTFSLSLLAQT